ncbi:MAG TPA: CBS domain-containing protein, partial [Vicinamibacteria bacterium]|nr:CBS domain-containing protein [Vicinamibacteria bacterium]
SRNGDAVGVITLSGVKDVPESERDKRTVSDTMEPLRDEHIIRPDTSLFEVLGRFGKGMQRLLVMERGELQGVVTHKELLRLMEVHKALAE